MKNVNYHLSMSLKKSPSLKFTRRWIKISERQDSLSPNCSRSCCTLANFLKSPTYPDQIPSQHKLPRSTLTRPLIPLETSQMFPSTSPNQTGTDISHHNNVLAQYPWVDTKLIDDIALGSFNISSLPKLHRENFAINILLNPQSKGTLSNTLSINPNQMKLSSQLPTS